MGSGAGMVTGREGGGRHRRPRDPDRWLILIGAVKLLKGLLFVSLGFGVLKMVHSDITDVLLRLAYGLRIDPESRFINLLLEKAEYLTPHRIRLIGMGIFLYATLDFVEGGGLVLGRPWAEYFTIVITALFLPYEVFEIARHMTWLKLGITLVNVVVLGYLLIHQRTRLRKRQQAREAISAKN
jgi:uncharacterized membrane protein (DUF2068 family)